LPRPAPGSLGTDLTHVIYTRDSADDTVNLYINGVPAASDVRGGDLSNWEYFELALGNELTGDRPWLGELYLVAIYDTALTSLEVEQNYLIGLIENTCNDSMF